MKKIIMKTMAIIMIAVMIIGIMPVQQVEGATKHGVAFYYFGEIFEGENGRLTYSIVKHGDTQMIESGKMVNRPEDPAVEGYTFDNWYTSNEFTEVFDFNTPITSSKTLYGRLIKKVQIIAYDKTAGGVGGGTVSISGAMPNYAGPGANYEQNLYADENYTFDYTVNDGYYFKGWSVNNPDNPKKYDNFSVSPMYLEYKGGEKLSALYAVFERTGSDTLTWNAEEGKTSEFEKRYKVSGAGIYAENLYLLDDSNNIAEVHWEGLTAEGKIPESGSAYFVVTLKAGVAIGSYDMVLTDNVGHTVYDVTVNVKHRVQKWLPVEPKCESTGNLVHWECLECGKFFSDKECLHETTKDAMKLDALGHDYGAWQYLTSTQHRRYCKRDNKHYETKIHTWDSGVITTQPTSTTTGIKTYTCTGCKGTYTETVPVTNEPHTFEVKYHETDNSAASNLVTSVVYGVATKTATIGDLKYSTEGRTFKGWRVYREYDGKWYIKDASGKNRWLKEVPEGGEYVLYASGASVKQTAPKGTVVHFYAQWENDTTFTVKYHETDNSAASNLVTSVVYGVSTKTATIGDLKYSTEGRTFKGWRVYREYDNKWYIKDASGKNRWLKEVPEGGEYVLYASGASVKQTAPKGTVVHFYAQWEE